MYPIGCGVVLVTNQRRQKHNWLIAHGKLAVKELVNGTRARSQDVEVNTALTRMLPYCKPGLGWAGIAVGGGGEGLVSGSGAHASL